VANTSNVAIFRFDRVASRTFIRVMLPTHFMEKTTNDPLGRLLGHNRPRYWIASGQWAKKCPAQKTHPDFGCRFSISPRTTIDAP
jgi:hypothetical protein